MAVSRSETADSVRTDLSDSATAVSDSETTVSGSETVVADSAFPTPNPGFTFPCTAPLGNYRSNRPNYRIDRIELEKTFDFLSFCFFRIFAASKRRTGVKL